MSSNETESHHAARTRRLLRGAQEIATTGDRWFVSAIQALGRIGHWARREAGVATRLAEQGEHERLDLLTATGSDAAYEPACLQQRTTSRLATEPAGVLPLWRALGRVVSEHAESRYRSLPGDRRFWELMRLIRSIEGEPCAQDAARCATPDMEDPAQRECG